jgi:tetratricopeptide (TPR) repeat protein
MRCGLLKESFQSFKRAILNNPKNGLYYKELAVLLDKIGNSKDVIAILTKAKELGKEDSTTCFLFGKSFAQTGKTDKAIEFLETAIKMNRNNLVARLELARIFIKQEELDLAQTHIQFILDYPLESPIKQTVKTLLPNSLSV